MTLSLPIIFGGLNALGWVAVWCLVAVCAVRRGRDDRVLGAALGAAVALALVRAVGTVVLVLMAIRLESLTLAGLSNSALPPLTWIAVMLWLVLPARDGRWTTVAVVGGVALVVAVLPFLSITALGPQVMGTATLVAQLGLATLMAVQTGKRPQQPSR